MHRGFSGSRYVTFVVVKVALSTVLYICTLIACCMPKNCPKAITAVLKRQTWRVTINQLDNDTRTEEKGVRA